MFHAEIVDLSDAKLIDLGFVGKSGTSRAANP